MTERFDYRTTLPYERHRDKDVDGSTMITSTKPFNDGTTEQFFSISPKGEVREISILFSYPNGFERQYVFRRDEFLVTAENRMTHFGSISYDKAGSPIRIHPAPFYFAEYAFWKDAPTDEDRAIIEEELERYHEALDELHAKYGAGNIPVEAFPDMEQLCPTYDAYGKRLRDLRGLSEFDPTQFVFKNGKWVVVEQVKSSRGLQEFLAEMKRVTSGEIKMKDSWIKKEDKTRDALKADWEEPFLYDEKRFTISRVGNQLTFRQESLGGRKKKIVQAPLQIDYEKLQKVMGNRADWEKVTEAYPTNFYAEL